MQKYFEIDPVFFDKKIISSFTYAYMQEHTQGAEVTRQLRVCDK